MSKNLEITKALESLETGQKQVVEETLSLIERIIDGFKEAKETDVKKISDSAEAFGIDPEDFSDDPEAYYNQIDKLIVGLLKELQESLERFSEIALACDKLNPAIEEIASEQAKANEKIWQIVNELIKYAKNEDEDEYELQECDAATDDEDEESLSSLLEYLNRQLMDFEENYIILIKLYNQSRDLPKLSTPTYFFSNSEAVAENPLVLNLLKKGVNLN